MLSGQLKLWASSNLRTFSLRQPAKLYLFLWTTTSKLIICRNLYSAMLWRVLILNIYIPRYLRKLDLLSQRKTTFKLEFKLKSWTLFGLEYLSFHFLTVLVDFLGHKKSINQFTETSSHEDNVIGEQHIYVTSNQIQKFTSGYPTGPATHQSDWSN